MPSYLISCNVKLGSCNIAAKVVAGISVKTIKSLSHPNDLTNIFENSFDVLPQRGHNTSIT